MKQPSPEFITMARRAIQMAREAPDDSVRYMADKIPTWVWFEPDQSMRDAGGCPKCKYLGLWVRDWPGYAPSLHGIIFLFEDGIRWMGGDVQEQTYRTLLHEFGHALQKDHVLDQMEKQRGRAAAQAYGPNNKPRGGCGCR